MGIVLLGDSLNWEGSVELQAKLTQAQLLYRLCIVQRDPQDEDPQRPMIRIPPIALTLPENAKEDLIVTRIIRDWPTDYDAYKPSNPPGLAGRLTFPLPERGYAAIHMIKDLSSGHILVASDRKTVVVRGLEVWASH